MAALVTNFGEEWVVDKLRDKSGTGVGAQAPEYVGWGTGAAPTETSTDLTTAAPEARTQCTLSKVGTGDAAVMRAVGTITATAARTITEVGLFHSSTGANMIVGSDHTSTVLATGEGIQYTIDINPE